MSNKLIFLITGLAYGGAETQLMRLAIQLKNRGWDVKIVSMLPPAAYVKELNAVGIPVASLNMRRGIADPRALFRFINILRYERPDIVHSHMVHANLLARFSRLLTKIPVLICTAHNIDEGGRKREWAYRFTDFLCDLTTQVCQAGLERYVRIGAVPRHKIRFVPNGIDTGQFKPDMEVRKRFRQELKVDDKFVWLAVGRFEKQKDYPNMLKAFAKVAKEHNNTLLLIAGQGPLREEAKQIANELGIEQKVNFLGVRKDIPKLMNAADAYVMSSAWEGMPMVLLEASAVGLPIVTTDVGGNREVVIHEKSGFLVPPKDPDALAHAMIRLMTLSPEEREKMGESGRRYIEEHYSLDNVVDKWESLYKELLMKKGINIY